MVRREHENNKFEWFVAGLLHLLFEYQYLYRSTPEDLSQRLKAAEGYR